MSIFEKTMNRRTAVRTIAAAGATIGAVVATGQIGLAQASSGRHTVSANVNLRSGASTSHRVITVIPKGATITLNGQNSNGFSSVTYNGQAGWAYSSYIVHVGSPSGDPVIVGEGTTTASVNLRSGPSTGHQVLRVVSAGSFVRFSNTVQNGFRYVTHNGLAGWISDQYIRLPSHAPQETARATAALNLRKEPSLSAKVLLVIPSGATVVLLDGGSGQFRKVTYKGTIGWAAYAYLN